MHGEDHEEHGFIHEIYWPMLLAFNVIGLVSELIGLEIGLYVLSTVTVLLIGRAAAKLLMRSYDATNIFMSIVAVVLLSMGYYLEAFIIFILYSASELIEEASEKLARRRLKNLLNLVPKRVTKVYDGDKFKEVDASEINRGDVVLVKPGEAIPVDGVVVEGTSEVNTSVLTGEPIPITVKPGDQVESGYINMSSALKVKALKPASESVLQSIVREVKRALESKGAIDRFIDRFAKPYTVIILAIFAVVFMTYDPYRALAILIATCPSAFIVTSSISTTLSIARLTTRGVIVRGSVALESAKKVKVVAFDKTGTLTVGSPKVLDIIPLNGFKKDQVISYAASLARFSTHPVSKAISSLGNYVSCEFVREYPGMGIEGRIDGSRVLLGNIELVKKFNISHDPSLESKIGQGIRAYLCVGNSVAGVIILDDQIKEDAKQLVSDLKSFGFKMVLISGDREDRVRKVAEELGIDEFYHSMKPDTKLKVIRDLRSRYGPVAMVGDGINDAPSLAESDFGIAIGKYAVVAEVADAVILSKLRHIVDLFRIAHARWGSLIASFGIALAIKGLALALGITGLIPLWAVALLGDDGSTLLGLIPMAKIVKTRFI